MSHYMARTMDQLDIHCTRRFFAGEFYGLGAGGEIVFT